MLWQEETKQKNSIILWYGIFLLSIVIVVWLFIFNSYLGNKIETLEKNIQSSNNTIQELQKNKSVQIYSLLEENKKLIETLEKKSKITDFIYNIRQLQDTYEVIFTWFSYSNWVISMSALAPFDPNNKAPQKVAKFIKNYRSDKYALFDLDFINTFAWSDNMTFNVNLKIK